jgi:hypothetical protein
MTFEEALILGFVTLIFAALSAWWVLRPFERHRRELRNITRHPAE